MRVMAFQELFNIQEHHQGGYSLSTIHPTIVGTELCPPHTDITGKNLFGIKLGKELSDMNMMFEVHEQDGYLHVLRVMQRVVLE